MFLALTSPTTAFSGLVGETSTAERMSGASDISHVQGGRRTRQVFGFEKKTYRRFAYRC